MSIAAWLDARDGASLDAAWRALGAREVEVSPDWGFLVDARGCARFAAAFLGWPIERLAWLAAEPDALPPPTFRGGGATQRCMLDGAFAWTGDGSEGWTIREVVEGARGVQRVTVDLFYDDGTREGGGRTAHVVRVFDGAAGTAASLEIDGRSVWTVGDVDLGPLDAFRHRAAIQIAWPYDPEGVRGLLAQVAAEVDAHFDVAATWPARVIADRVIENSDVRLVERHFEAGDFALELVEHRDGGKVNTRATLRGLPWGHGIWQLQLWPEGAGMDGQLELCLPLAQIDAIRARLATIPGVAVTPL